LFFLIGGTQVWKLEVGN